MMATLVFNELMIISRFLKEYRSELIYFLFSIRIQDNNQRSVFLIFGAGNVPFLEKPGSWLVLAKRVKSIFGIVRFQLKMHVIYGARNVVCALDTWRSRRYNWLQMFSTHFPRIFLVEDWLSIFYLFNIIKLFFLHFNLLFLI